MTSRPLGRPRLYDARWRKESNTYLRQHRHCLFCLERGNLVRATIVDHIIPHRGDERLFWDKVNWQALCRTCHNGAKQKQEKLGHTIGCDEQGNPIDANHHWNRRPSATRTVPLHPGGGRVCAKTQPKGRPPRQTRV